MKFSIQSASAKFPYRIRMVCGHIEIRLLNLKAIGRYFDDDVVINAGSGICAECDLAKAYRREKYQKRLNERHGPGCLGTGKSKRLLVAKRTAAVAAMSLQNKPIDKAIFLLAAAAVTAVGIGSSLGIRVSVKPHTAQACATNNC